MNSLALLYSPFGSVINSVLGNLEEAAIFLHLEVQVASLINRKPSSKLQVPIKSKEDSTFLFVNDAYPQYEAMYFKTSQGELLSKHTPFLKARDVVKRKGMFFRPMFMFHNGDTHQEMFKRKGEHPPGSACHLIRDNSRRPEPPRGPEHTRTITAEEIRNFVCTPAVTRPLVDKRNH